MRKQDIPKIDVSNSFIVYVGKSDSTAHIGVEPAIRTNTGVDIIQLNGLSSVDVCNGLIKLRAIIYPDGSYIFSVSKKGTNENKILENIITDSVSLYVESKGDAEHDKGTYSGTIHILLSTIPESFSANRTVNIGVSGLEQTVSAAGVAESDTSTSQGVKFSVDYMNGRSSWTTTPESPGNALLIDHNIAVTTPIGSSVITKPINVSINDTRKYTDQEYITAVKCDDMEYKRGNVVIYEVSADEKSSKVFRENPGNGYFIGPGTVTDSSGSDHTYDVVRTSKGSVTISSNTSCIYYDNGVCTYGDTCVHTTGLHKLTNSVWKLEHNGSYVAESYDAVYNSDVPPSAGWVGAKITGSDAELDYMGMPYAYSSRYTGVTYRPDDDGLCTEDNPHEIEYYTRRPPYSKSFSGWGTYGESSVIMSPVDVLSKDTVTGNIAGGVVTCNIYDDNPNILLDAIPVSTVGFIAHPIIASQYDYGLSVCKQATVSGYGTSSSIYGFAMNTVSPTYDWAHMYLYRPRSCAILPYTDPNNIATHALKIQNTNRVSRAFIRYNSKYLSSSNCPLIPATSVGHLPIESTAEVHGRESLMTTHKPSGVCSSSDISCSIDISATYKYTIPDEIKLTIERHNKDLTSVLAGNADTEYGSCSVHVHTKTSSEEYGNMVKAVIYKYILFDGILYYSGGPGVESTDDTYTVCLDIDYNEAGGFYISGDADYLPAYKYICTWKAVTPSQSRFIKSTVNTSDGTSNKSYLTVFDIENTESSSEPLFSNSDYFILNPKRIQTLYHTHGSSSIRALLRIDEDRNDYAIVYRINGISDINVPEGLGEIELKDGSVTPCTSDMLSVEYEGSVVVTSSLSDTNGHYSALGSGRYDVSNVKIKQNLKNLGLGTYAPYVGYDYDVTFSGYLRDASFSLHYSDYLINGNCPTPSHRHAGTNMVEYSPILSYINLYNKDDSYSASNYTYSEDISINSGSLLTHFLVLSPTVNVWIPDEIESEYYVISCTDNMHACTYGIPDTYASEPKWVPYYYSWAKYGGTVGYTWSNTERRNEGSQKVTGGNVSNNSMSIAAPGLTGLGLYKIPTGTIYHSTVVSGSYTASSPVYKDIVSSGERSATVTSTISEIIHESSSSGSTSESEGPKAVNMFFADPAYRYRAIIPTTLEFNALSDVTSYSNIGYLYPFDAPIVGGSYRSICATSRIRRDPVYKEHSYSEQDRVHNTKFEARDDLNIPGEDNKYDESHAVKCFNDYSYSVSSSYSGTIGFLDTTAYRKTLQACTDLVCTGVASIIPKDAYNGASVRYEYEGYAHTPENIYIIGYVITNIVNTSIDLSKKTIKVYLKGYVVDYYTGVGIYIDNPPVGGVSLREWYYEGSREDLFAQIKDDLQVEHIDSEPEELFYIKTDSVRILYTAQEPYYDHYTVADDPITPLKDESRLFEAYVAMVGERLRQHVIVAVEHNLILSKIPHYKLVSAKPALMSIYAHIDDDPVDPFYLDWLADRYTTIPLSRLLCVEDDMSYSN